MNTKPKTNSIDNILDKLTETLQSLRDQSGSFYEFELNVGYAMGFIRQEEDYRNEEEEGA